jgi:hypothetical protein
LIPSGHIAIGLVILTLMIASLSAKYLLTPKRASFPAWGWAGLTLMVGFELLLFRRVSWVATFFTPIAWTGYLLFADALVARLRGHSRLGSAPREFLALTLWSIPLWLIFEAYNLRLANWAYVGLPNNLALRAFGYGWSFATIWPAIHETADLTQALGLVGPGGSPRVALHRSNHVTLAILGLLLVTVPVLVPVRVGQYLFGGVWLGFALLLDPINYRLNGRSLLRDWEIGQTGTLYSFALAGLVCGILWEFWNYWARAKWLYVFPIAQQWKIFQMPLPGYLGFPPFALECFVMYEFLRCVRNHAGSRRVHKWEVARS